MYLSGRSCCGWVAPLFFGEFSHGDYRALVFGPFSSHLTTPLRTRLSLLPGA